MLQLAFGPVEGTWFILQTEPEYTIAVIVRELLTQYNSNKTLYSLSKNKIYNMYLSYGLEKSVMVTISVGFTAFY